MKPIDLLRECLQTFDVCEIRIIKKTPEKPDEVD